MAKPQIIRSGSCRVHWESGELNYTLTDDGVITVRGNCALCEVEAPGAKKSWDDLADDEIYSDYQSPFKDLDFHTVKFETGVTYLGERCLAECKGLKHIELHDGIYRIKEDFAKGSPVDYYEENGLLFLGSHDNPRHALIGCTDNFNEENLIIPEGTKTIADSAFAGKEFIRTLSIPLSMQFLGWHTFIGTSIKHLHIPDTQAARLEWLMAFHSHLGACDSRAFPLKSISLPMHLRNLYLHDKDWYDRLGCTFEFRTPQKTPHKDDIFDLDKIPMEILDKGWTKYRPYTQNTNHANPDANTL